MLVNPLREKFSFLAKSAAERRRFGLCRPRTLAAAPTSNSGGGGGAGDPDGGGVPPVCKGAGPGVPYTVERDNYRQFSRRAGAPSGGLQDCRRKKDLWGGFGYPQRCRVRTPGEPTCQGLGAFHHMAEAKVATHVAAPCYVVAISIARGHQMVKGGIPPMIQRLKTKCVSIMHDSCSMLQDANIK